jgi:hypothetical protein
MWERRKLQRPRTSPVPHAQQGNLNIGKIELSRGKVRIVRVPVLQRPVERAFLVSEELGVGEGAFYGVRAYNELVLRRNAGIKRWMLFAHPSCELLFRGGRTGWTLLGGRTRSG